MIHGIKTDGYLYIHSNFYNMANPNKKHPNFPAFVYFVKYYKKLTYKQKKSEIALIIGCIATFEYFKPKSKNNHYYKLKLQQYNYALQLLTPKDKLEAIKIMDETKQTKPSTLLKVYEAKRNIAKK